MHLELQRYTVCVERKTAKELGNQWIVHVDKLYSHGEGIASTGVVVVKCFSQKGIQASYGHPYLGKIHSKFT